MSFIGFRITLFLILNKSNILMPVVIEWDWIDLHLSVTIEKSSTIHGLYHYLIFRGRKLKNFFELVWGFWVYLANRETTNTSHFSSGHVCFDIFNCEPKEAQDVWSIPKMTAQLLDRKVSLPALTSTLISVMISTKTNWPLFYQHLHIACEFPFLKCNKFSSPFNPRMRWFPFITWIYCKCP